MRTSKNIAALENSTGIQKKRDRNTSILPVLAGFSAMMPAIPTAKPATTNAEAAGG